MHELKQLNVYALGGKAWFDRLYVRNFDCFFGCLAKLVQVIEETDSVQNRYVDGGTHRRVLDLEQLARLHGLLYQAAVANVRYLSMGLPGAQDEYENCPLVVIYTAMAACTDFMRQHFPLVERDLYTTRPVDVPYCVRHGLVADGDTPIRHFSLQQLMCALQHIECSAHSLAFEPDLVAYIDALDVRVCDFLVRAMDATAHNVESYRVEYDRDLYTCNTATEYHLVVLMLGVRQLIETAVPLWRDEERMPPMSEDEETLVMAVRAKFIHEIQSVHSDIIEDSFYKMYTYQSITNSEGYLFLKANPLASRIEAGAIIRQFRNVPQWRRITETAARSVADFLFEPETDALGFKIAFALAADLIFSQTLRTTWFRHSADGHRLRLMDSGEFQVMIEDSYNVPIVLVLLNDACVLFKGRVTVFGQRDLDYYRALVHWLTIIRQELNGQYAKCRSVMPLVEALLCSKLEAPAKPRSALTPRDFTPQEESGYIEPRQIIAQMSAEQRPYRAPPAHTSRSTPMSIFMERSRAREHYDHITARIETKPQELDANSIVGDTDETGFPQTSRSAWT